MSNAVHVHLSGRAAVLDRAPAGVSKRTIERGMAIAEALFATEKGPPPPDRLTWLAGEFANFLGHAGAWARFLVGSCALFTTVLGPLLALKFRAFGSLAPEERLHILERLERSPFALVFLGIKTVLCIVYYEHPEAALEIGFDGLCLSGRKRA